MYQYACSSWWDAGHSVRACKMVSRLDILACMLTLLCYQQSNAPYDLGMTDTIDSTFCVSLKSIIVHEKAEKPVMMSSGDQDLQISLSHQFRRKLNFGTERD